MTLMHVEQDKSESIYLFLKNDLFSETKAVFIVDDKSSFSTFNFFVLIKWLRFIGKFSYIYPLIFLFVNKYYYNK